MSNMSFFDALNAKAAEARAADAEQSVHNAHDELEAMDAPRFTGGGRSNSLATVFCEAIGKSSKIGTKGMYSLTVRIIDNVKDAITLGNGASFSANGLEAVLPVMREDQDQRSAKEARKAEYTARGETMPDEENKAPIKKFSTGQALKLRLGSTLVLMATGKSCPNIETIGKGKICSVQIRAVLDEPKYPGRPTIRIGTLEVVDTVADLSPEKENLRLASMWMSGEFDRVPVQLRYPQPPGVVPVKTAAEVRDLKIHNLTPETAYVKNMTVHVPVFRNVPPTFVLGIMNYGLPIVAKFSAPSMKDDLSGLPGGFNGEKPMDRLFFNIEADLYRRDPDRIPKPGSLGPLELKAELLACYARKFPMRFDVSMWQIWIGVKNHQQLFPGMAGFQMIRATPMAVSCYVGFNTAIGSREAEPNPTTLALTVCSGGNDKKLPVESNELIGQVDLVVGAFNAGFLVDWESLEQLCKAQNAFGLPGLQISIDPSNVPKHMKMRQPLKPGMKSTERLQSNELNERGHIICCFESDVPLAKYRETHFFVAVPNLYKRIANKFVTGESTAIGKLYVDMYTAARKEIVEKGDLESETDIDRAAEKLLAARFGKLLVYYLQGGAQLPDEVAHAFDRGTAPRADMIIYAIEMTHALKRGVTTLSSCNEVKILNDLSGVIFPSFESVAFANRKRTPEEDEFENRKRAEPTEDDLADMDLDGQEELAKQRALEVSAAAAAAQPEVESAQQQEQDRDSDSHENSPSPMQASMYDDDAAAAEAAF